MRNFIEDYLNNPADAVSSAVISSGGLSWADAIDNDKIYEEMASGQFRLYEEIIFCHSADDLHYADSVRPVA